MLSYKYLSVYNMLFFNLFYPLFFMTIRLRIVHKRRPREDSESGDFEWLCSSMGFCEPIDRDKTATNIIRLLIKNSKKCSGLRSDDIAENVGKSRGATVNHLNKLIGSGLIVKRKNTYLLREDSLENTIREVRRDIERMFEDLESVAKKIDESFGI